MIGPGKTAGQDSIAGFHLEIGTGGENHLTSLGSTADFPPIDFGGFVGRAPDIIGSPTTDSIAMDGMGVTYCDPPSLKSTIEHLQPDKFTDNAHLFPACSPGNPVGSGI